MIDCKKFEKNKFGLLKNKKGFEGASTEFESM